MIKPPGVNDTSNSCHNAALFVTAQPALIRQFSAVIWMIYPFFNLGEAKINDVTSWNERQVYNDTSNSCHNAVLFVIAQPALIRQLSADIWMIYPFFNLGEAKIKDKTSWTGMERATPAIMPRCLVLLNRHLFAN